MPESDYKSVIRNGAVLLPPVSRTKNELIVEMVRALAARNLVSDAESTVKAVLARESLMSTGMQHGVAIPHAKTDTTDSIVTAVAVIPEGMDFGSVDGEPSRIFILTVSSVLRSGPHIRYLAEIGRLLERPSVRSRILKAATPDELVSIMTE